MHTHGGDIYGQPVRLDYSANLNFLGMPESVRRAACEGVAASEHYPDVHCRELIRGLEARENVPGSWIACGNGAADLIFAAALAEKPGRAVLCAPTFHEYTQALQSVDCEIEYFALEEKNGFAYTDGILELLTPDTDMVMLCNPNNPTGMPLPRECLVSVLERCRKSGIRLILDECFIEFTENAEENTAVPLLGEYPCLAVLKAFTKIYAMAGLRLGYLLCSDGTFMRRLAEVHQPWNVSVPAQFAGAAACRETDYPLKTRKLLKTEKQYMLGELRDMDVRIYGSEANYIFFRALPGLADALREQGILIRDCSNYRGLEEGYYRIAVRSHEENEIFLPVLRETLGRLAKTETKCEQ